MLLSLIVPATVCTFHLVSAMPAPSVTKVSRAAEARAARTATAAASGDTTAIASEQVPLTVEALRRMTAFWEVFLREPRSVQDARKAYRKSLSWLVPTKPGGTAETRTFTFDVVDMQAMVNAVPAVAADMKRAGLTPQQWEQYIQSLYMARLADLLAQAAQPGASVSPAAAASAGASSLVWKNVAVLRAHPKELETLIATGVWVPHLPITPGQAAPTLAVRHWLNNASFGSGSTTTFGDGHVYLLDFTAHWCGPCQGLYPRIIKLQTKYADRGVRVLYVTTLFGFFGPEDMAPAAELDSLKQYVTHHQLNAPMVVVNKPEMIKYYDGPQANLPQLVIIDGAGKIQSFPNSIEEIEASFNALTAASSAPASAPRKGG